MTQWLDGPITQFLSLRRLRRRFSERLHVRDQFGNLLFGQLSLVRRHDRRIAGDQLGVGLKDRLAQVILIRDHGRSIIQQHASSKYARDCWSALAVTGVALLLGEEL